MKKILVVDDEPDILMAVKLILSRKQIEVETLPNWENIPHIIKSFNPDLILLDVSLGGADGRDICKMLKDSKETKHIKIILFSAYHKVQDKLIECKPDDFIAKPFDAAYLINTVMKQLN